MAEEDSYIYGIRAIIEAINAGKEPEKIFLQAGLSGALMNELKTLLQQKEIVYNQVPVEKLNRITRQNHQGAVCLISSISYTRVEQVVPHIYEQGKTPLILILDRITDVRNVGAIARSAECMGVDAIVIPAQGGAQLNADAVKTSAGALHKINVCREPNLKLVIHYLKQCGIKLVACTEKSKQPISAIDFDEPVAIIMGSEDEGVSPEYLKLCDERAMIPMTGTIASLNVSAATAIILYEVVRQRRVV